MSDSQTTSKHIIKTKENIGEVLQNNILNLDNEYIIENNSKISVNKEESRIKSNKGQYLLTPLECLILNKLMPQGFKFETEENYLKTLESSKNQTKKIKKTIKQFDNFNKSNTGNYNNINSLNQLKKINNQNISNLPKNINPSIYTITQKCWLGLNMIKEIQWAYNFYQSNDPNIPCFAKIEQKLNNYEYNSFYDFAMDVRKIWFYYFNLGEQDNNDIYNITSKMSDNWEKIYSELENCNYDHYSISNNIKKRAEKLKKEYSECKIQDKKNEILSPSIKKVIEQNNGNKPVTLEEKNNLGNLIRSLNKEQLKGIVKILSNNSDNKFTNYKYFEFDIDVLSIKKFRELEKYVKSCIGSNNMENSNKIQNNVNKKENYANKNNNKDINNKYNYNQVNNKEEDKNESKNINEKNNQLSQNIKNNDIKSETFSESDSISSESSLSD